MLQRIGIAQALVNDPELVIFDEPMSGLDPLGRRDVRALILRLRDRGCTVFFSSHVLSDAEALCSRVAILAKGRMVAGGRMTELARFSVHGWELILGNVTEAMLAPLQPRARRIVQISEGRYAIDLPLDSQPERILSEFTAAGAALVSLNPIRDTLEDYFVKQVTAPEAQAPRRHPGAEGEDARRPA
jgi:ABC-2 type transport system ATP-binding protein